MKLKQTFDPARFPPLQDNQLKLGLGSFLILLGVLILYFEVGSSGLFILNNLNLTFQKQIFL